MNEQKSIKAITNEVLNPATPSGAFKKHFKQLYNVITQPITMKTKKATGKAAKKTTSRVVKKVVRKISKKQVVKKATKKTATPAAKKSLVRKSSKSTAIPMVYAADTECFWTKDGQVLDSLIALNEALNDMSEAVFVYHAHGEQNDFAQWVQNVLDDAECAEALRRSRKAATARTAVKKRLKLYSV